MEECVESQSEKNNHDKRVEAETGKNNDELSGAHSDPTKKGDPKLGEEEEEEEFGDFEDGEVPDSRPGLDVEDKESGQKEEEYFSLTELKVEVKDKKEDIYEDLNPGNDGVEKENLENERKKFNEIELQNNDKTMEVEKQLNNEEKIIKADQKQIEQEEIKEEEEDDDDGFGDFNEPEKEAILQDGNTNPEKQLPRAEENCHFKKPEPEEENLDLFSKKTDILEKKIISLFKSNEGKDKLTVLTRNNEVAGRNSEQDCLNSIQSRIEREKERRGENVNHAEGKVDFIPIMVLLNTFLEDNEDKRMRSFSKSKYPRKNFDETSRKVLEDINLSFLKVWETSKAQSYIQKNIRFIDKIKVKGRGEAQASDETFSDLSFEDEEAEENEEKRERRQRFVSEIIIETSKQKNVQTVENASGAKHDEDLLKNILDESVQKLEIVRTPSKEKSPKNKEAEEASKKFSSPPKHPRLHSSLSSPINTLFGKLLRGQNKSDQKNSSELPESRNKTHKRAETIKAEANNYSEELYIRRKSIDLGNIEEISVVDLQEISWSKRENIGVFEFDLKPAGAYSEAEKSDEPLRKRTLEQHNLLEKIKILGQETVEKNILRDEEEDESSSSKSDSLSNASGPDFLSGQRGEDFDVLGARNDSLQHLSRHDSMAKKKKHQSNKDFDDEPYFIEGSIFD